MSGELRGCIDRVFLCNDNPVGVVVGGTLVPNRT